MAKKLGPLAQDEEARLADAVRASARQIWQAGLGAFVKAQQEGGRAFTRLVRDGTELQKRARKVEDATDTVARAAGRTTRRASGTWDKLEQVFEERVARALATIGVPARAEIEALNERIGELEKMVAELGRGPAQEPAPARRRAAKPAAAAGPANKTAAKATVARKTAAKKIAATKTTAKKATAKKPAGAKGGA